MSKKETKIGTIISLDLPQITNQLSSIGFDFILIDLEHGSISDTTISSIILANKDSCKIFIRIAEINESNIKHALDIGCDGIIAPRVECLSELKTLVEYSFYPPIGKRSIGFCLANKYGLGFDEYTNNFQPTILAQVESVKGLQIAKEIAAYDRISGIFIGPYDLSMSLGIPGQFESDIFIEPYNSVRNVCAEQHKLFCTFVSNNQTVDEEINKGTDMIAVGVDANLFLNTYLQIVKPFKSESL